jgi:hypothetical protein
MGPSVNASSIDSYGGKYFLASAAISGSGFLTSFTNLSLRTPDALST